MKDIFGSAADAPPWLWGGSLAARDHGSCFKFLTGVFNKLPPPEGRPVSDDLQSSLALSSTSCHCSRQTRERQRVWCRGFNASVVAVLRVTQTVGDILHETDSASRTCGCSHPPFLRVPLALAGAHPLRRKAIRSPPVRLDLSH